MRPGEARRAALEMLTTAPDMVCYLEKHDAFQMTIVANRLHSSYLFPDCPHVFICVSVAPWFSDAFLRRQTRRAQAPPT